MISAPGDDSGTEIYRINTDFAGAETRKGTLNLRSGPGRNYKILAAYKNTLTVQVIAKTSSAWYERGKQPEIQPDPVFWIRHQRQHRHKISG